MAPRLHLPSHREEERDIPLPYERAVAMLVTAVRGKTGHELETLGDGFFRGGAPGGTLTVRLHRKGADTCVAVRMEEGQRRDLQLGALGWAAALVSALVYVSHRHGPHFLPALGVLLAAALVGGVLLDRLLARASARGVQREILVHDVLRAMEDGAETQGIAGGYRIAPGVDAARPAPPDAAEDEHEDHGGSDADAPSARRRAARRLPAS